MTSKWKDWASLVCSWRQEHMRPFDCIFSWLEYRFDHHGQTCYDGTKRKRTKDWWRGYEDELIGGWRLMVRLNSSLCCIMMFCSRPNGCIVEWLVGWFRSIDRLLDWLLVMIGWLKWFDWMIHFGRMNARHRIESNRPITRNHDILSTPLYDAMSQVVIVYLLCK